MILVFKFKAKKLFQFFGIGCIISMLAACAGYQAKRGRNPFSIYQVQSVGVPMFVNLTALPNVSGAMTNEIYRLLASYSNLKVYSGESEKADAILIGILTSEKSRNEVLNTETQTFTNDQALLDSIGNRNKFYIPTAVSYKLRLRLVLIKDPTVTDMEMLKGELAPYVRHSKVLFNRLIDINSTYGKVIKGTSTSDQGGTVNFSRNKALFEKSWQKVAKSTAQHVKDVILEAF